MGSRHIGRDNPPFMLVGSRVDYFFLLNDSTVTMRPANEIASVKAS
ncbi:hypothetical protein IEC97_25850 [Neobacillus cucumis]|nr:MULTISPECIES: hypothetical protein [Bacillaceae]MBI0580766.1 hypothetical protein [Neobacillus cucumis]